MYAAGWAVGGAESGPGVSPRLRRTVRAMMVSLLVEIMLSLRRDNTILYNISTQKMDIHKQQSGPGLLVGAHCNI